MAGEGNTQQQNNILSDYDLFINFLEGKSDPTFVKQLQDEGHYDEVMKHVNHIKIFEKDPELQRLFIELFKQKSQAMPSVELSTLVKTAQETKKEFDVHARAKLKEYKLKLIEKKSAKELVKDIEKVIQSRKLTTRAWNTLSYPFRKAAIRAKKEKIQILREGIVRAGEKNCGNTSAERQYRADLKRLLEKGCRKEQYKFNRNVVGTSAVIFIIGLIFFPPLAIAIAVVGMPCFFLDLPNRMVQHTRDNVTASLWEEAKQARADTDKEKIAAKRGETIGVAQVNNTNLITARPSEIQLHVLSGGQSITEGSQTSINTKKSNRSLSKAFKRFTRMGIKK